MTTGGKKPMLFARFRFCLLESRTAKTIVLIGIAKRTQNTKNKLGIIRPDLTTENLSNQTAHRTLTNKRTHWSRLDHSRHNCSN
jgi:hypothetical protein